MQFETINYLLNKKNLLSPNYHKLNEEPGARLLHAVLCAYLKHNLNDPDIGWDQLDSILYNAVVNELDDELYQKWMESLENEGN